MNLIDYSIQLTASFWDIFLDFNDEYNFIGNIKLIAFIVSTVAGLLFTIYVLRLMQLKKNKVNLVKTIHPPAPATSGAVAARWGEITRHITSVREAEWKFAIIEADKLVDDLLKTAGFPGETMGDRLISAEGKLQTLNLLWEAHKIRNRLAHDTNYFLRHAEASRAINNFEAAIKELGAI